MRKPGAGVDSLPTNTKPVKGADPAGRTRHPGRLKPALSGRSRRRWDREAHCDRPGEADMRRHGGAQAANLQKRPVGTMVKRLAPPLPGIPKSGHSSSSAVMVKSAVFAPSDSAVICHDRSGRRSILGTRPSVPMPRGIPRTGRISLQGGREHLAGTLAGNFGQRVEDGSGLAERGDRGIFGHRWDGCRPPQTASQCAKMVVLKATRRGGR